ncbi:MAG: hypothetical protein O3A00_25805 [Planctomycetota bacterium]|nr:hypothetical protein [Planctomycetota bacterium]
MLDETLHTVSDDQIKDGLAELRENGQLGAMSPEEIFEHIRRKSIVPRKKKLELRAAEVSEDVRLVTLIQGRALTAMNEGDSLKGSLAQVLAGANVDEQEVDMLAEEMMSLVNQRIREVMTDTNLPGRNDVVLGFLRGILQDSKIAALLR